MTSTRVFQRLLLWTLGLSMASYSVAERDPLLLVLLLVLTVVGWWLTEHRAGRGLPRWVSNLILLGVVVGALLRAMEGGPLVSAFTGFLASLLLIKLWSKREVRDYGQLLTMSLFLTIGATLTDNSLLLGAVLLALLPVFVSCVMLAQVVVPLERDRAAHLAAGREGPVWLRAWGPMRGSIRTLTVVSIASGLLLSVLIFILVPRGVGMGQLGPMIRPTAGRVTGFADRVQLGQGGLISQSQATVLEMRLHAGDIDQPLGRSGQIHYLRGAVLEQYRGGAWTRGASGIDARDDAPEPGQRVRLDRDPRAVLPLVQTIEIREVARGETPLFAVYRPRVLSFRGQASAPGRIAWDRRTWTVRREGEPGPLRYEVTSYPDPAALEEGEAEARRAGISFPSERVAGLAKELLRSAGIEPDPAIRPVTMDAQAARVFETHLRSRFSYTLDILAAPAGRDPTEWFLFDERRGHCEYFASALAALCRSVGIDARVVTGYVAAEFDAARGTYVVRAANAHAWVEVYAGSSRWQSFDATPPGDLEAIHASRPGALRSVGRWFDSVEDWWAASVVSFDSRSQARLWGVRPDRPSWIERVVPRRGEEDSQGENFSTRELAPAAAALALALLAAGVALGVIVLVRRLRARSGTAIGIPAEAARLLGEVSRELTRRGVARPAWQPPLDHAEVASRVLAEPGAIAREAVMEVYSYAFGPRDPAALDRARRAVVRLRRLPRSSERRG